MEGLGELSKGRYNAPPLVTKLAFKGSGFEGNKRLGKLVKLVLARLIRGAIIVDPLAETLRGFK